MPAVPRTVFEIRAAKDSLITNESFVHLLASLKNTLKVSFWQRIFGGQDTISLEIACLDQSIFFIVTCPEPISALVKAQIAAHYPDALINHMNDYLEPWLSSGSRSTAQVYLSGPTYLPIQTVQGKGIDLLASVLGVLSKIPPKQAAVIQIVLSAPSKGWSSYAKKIVAKGVGSPEKFEAHPQKALIETKIALPGFTTDIRLASVAPESADANLVISQLGASFGVFTLADGNSLSVKKLPANSQVKLQQAMITRSADYTPANQILNLLEVATIFHFPNADLSGIRNIAWGKTLKGEPPSNLPIAEDLSDEEKQQINFFARTEYKNRMAIFGIRNGDDRRRHIYILGKSGTGKSTLIANMAIADIRNRHGMAIVDPHGDLCDIILDYIPSYRINDVAYIDPSTKDSSIRINPLYAKNPEQKELLVSGIMSVFKKIWADLWSARMEYILRNSLHTLAFKDGSTFLDIPKLLTDDRFRNEYLRSVDDPTLLAFWKQEYDAYSEKFRAEAISAILNKVGQFITSPTIRNVIGHSNNTIDLEKMMDEGKILIINLSQGKIGEDNAALLGAMIITQIQIAAMNRINRPKEERRDFYLYVDEFQNFATTSFIKILSEARKFHLNLILANQYTAQLPEDIQKAIFGNAGTIMSFVVGAEDANRLVGELGNYYTQDDLVSLARHQVVAKIMIDGAMSKPFPAYTLPLPFSKNQNREKVMRSSTERYYRPNVKFK